MSLPSSLTPLFSTGSSAAAEYQIERSLRFNSADSAYLSRTPAVAGDRTTWTWAGWMKPGVLGANDFTLFSRYTGSGGDYYTTMRFNQHILRIEQSSGAGYDWYVRTTRVFRDSSAWYHIVVAINTNLADADSRVKLYINGVEESAANFTRSNPARYSDTWINTTSSHSIGEIAGGGYFDGYLADIHFIDGQALDHTSFTEVSATTGQLIPLAYAGSYTGNSFHLDFADNSALTSGSNAGIGKDTSGLGNYWNTSGLSVTAGAGNDSLVDSPTNYGTDTSGVGGVVRGNYATLNPLTANSAVLSNGNLRVVNSTNATRNEGTLAVTSGKYYWEGTAVSNMQTNSIGGRIGFCRTSSKSDPEQIEFGIVWHANEGLLRQQSGTFTTVSTGTNYNDGDIVGVGLDADNNIAYFYKNGSLTYTYNFSSFISAGDYSLTPHAWGYFSSTWDYNFGQRAFAYQTPGTNRPAATFLALCDTNLGAPAVAKPNQHFDVITYTGNGSTLTIPNANSTPTSIAFDPGFIWFKQRASPKRDNNVYDVIRGTTKLLSTNGTSADASTYDVYPGTGSEQTVSGLTAFNTGSKTVDVGSSNVANGSSSSYVAWAWYAGATTDPSNQAGSITSQVRANVSAGFSVVTYTGNATAGATVGHGLGVAPEFLISKSRSDTGGWLVYHKSIGNTKYLGLNSTIAEQTSSDAWNNTTPSSTVFTLGGSGAQPSGVTRVAYCFAPVAGYSNFGSYTGNGSTDGPFVYTGFRPKWVMIKASSFAGESWYIFDTALNTYNVIGNGLVANLSIAEFSATLLDFLSNGYKIRAINTLHNSSGATYIYAAFAENPFQYARAR